MRPRRRLLTWLFIATGVCAASCRPPAPSHAQLAGGNPSEREAIELLLGNDLRAARALGAAAPSLSLTGTGISGDSLGAFVDVADGRCALVLGRGTRGVQDVDVFVFDDDGTVLASDEAPTKDASLLICPPQAARVFASARLAAGFGLFGLTLQAVAPERAAQLTRRFGASSGRASEVSELASTWPGLDERLAEHRRRVGGRWETLRKVALPLDPRAYVNISASVEPHTCLDLYITPSDDVAHLELRGARRQRTLDWKRRGAWHRSRSDDLLLGAAGDRHTLPPPRRPGSRRAGRVELGQCRGRWWHRAL